MLKHLFNIFAPQKEENPPYPVNPSEKKLSLSELRYRRLFETAQDGILILDADSGKIEDANPYLQEILAYSKNELLGKHLWELGVFKDIVSSKEAFLKLQKQKYIRYKDLPLKTKNGRSIDAEFISNVYMVGNQKVIQCNIREISEFKKSDEKLILLSKALEVAANGIVITDDKGIIQWVNSSLTTTSGYTFEEAVGKSSRILIFGKNDTLFFRDLWKTISSGKVWHGELINRKKDGGFYPMETTITPVKDQDGEIKNFIAIQQDLESRKNLEKDLVKKNVNLVHQSKVQEETKQAMLNVMEDLEEAKRVIEIERARDEAMLISIGSGIIATDQNLRVTFMNEAAERLVGWKNEEVIGKLWFDFVPMVDENGNMLPEDERPIKQAISNKKLSTFTTPLDNYYFIRKDKTKFPVSVVAAPIILNRKVIGAIGVYQDITREKEIDKAKSEFVSLASHQLRTPLGIMKWYLEALENEDYMKKSPRMIRNYFDEISDSNERVLSLVRDLLSVSRIDQGRVKNVPKSVDLIQAIKEVVDQMQIVTHVHNITLGLTVPENKIPPVNIDVLRFSEVIENLVGNAIEYSVEAGSVNVTVKKQDDILLISVKDTGIGISKEDQKKLFTKFFRSEKAVTQNPEGSGLGLYVVKSYIEGWGGKLSFESVEGRGSTFTIHLPLCQK